MFPNVVYPHPEIVRQVLVTNLILFPSGFYAVLCLGNGKGNATNMAHPGVILQLGPTLPQRKENFPLGTVTSPEETAPERRILYT